MKSMIIKNLTLLLSITVLFTSCGYLNSELHRKQTDTLYREGQGQYKAKKYEDAKKTFAALLEKDGGHYEGAFAFSAACYALGQYKEALSGFQNAADISSTDEVKSWLIETHLKLGRKDEADKIASTLPADKSKAFTEKIANAVPSLDTAGRIDPRDEKMMADTFALMREGLYSEARKATAKILKDKPDFMQANVVMLVIDAGAKDYAAAAETAKKLSASTDGEIYLDAFGAEYRKLIVSILRELEAEKAPSEMNMIAGLILCRNMEEPAIGAEYIMQALKNAKAEEYDATLLFNIGNALWRAQKVDQAVDLYELSLKKNAAQPELAAHLANIHRYRLGNITKAN